MAIVRSVKKENPFVQINKVFFEDPNLTWDAKGLMGYILSRPNDWKINKTDLVKRSVGGAGKVESALLCLLANGYINWYPIRDHEGKIEEWVYDVYEQPEFNPRLEECKAEGKRRIQAKKEKTKKKNKKAQEKLKSPESDNPKVEKNPESDNPEMDNPAQDNPAQDNPVYTNNDSTNIKSTNIKSTNNKSSSSLKEVKKRVKKNDDDEKIFEIIQSGDNCYSELLYFFNEKQFLNTKREAIATIKKLIELNIKWFRMSDIERAYEKVIEAIVEGNVSYPPNYFAVILTNEISNSKIIKIQEQKKLKEKQKTFANKVPFYNWLEDNALANIEM